MGGDNVEPVWYGLCLIKAVVILLVVSVVILLCKRFLRSIPWHRVKRRSAKHPMVHLLGTLQPPRNFDASESKAADLDPGDIKRRGALDERL
jgi:hypothetical protein